MKDTSVVGKLGEDLACQYLEKRRYIVLRRNEKHAWGEIDIIARHKETKLLIFVEVKALVGAGEYRPEQHYNFDKARKTQRAAQLFAGRNPKWYDPDVGWRIDLLAVSLRKVPVTSFADCIIRHYENV